MRFRIIAFLALPLLAACTTGPVTKSYVFTPPDSQGGRLCLSQCDQAKGYCRQSCEFGQRQCVSKIDAQAITDYDRYTRMQFASGEPVEFRPRDFERTATCDDELKNCGDACDKNYLMCYETCGGTVDIISSCQALCF